MMELNLINPTHEKRGYMRHNSSHKFESSFVGVNVPENNSVLFGSLSNSRLGVWVAHGEGKFDLPYAEENYNIFARYAYSDYPANPNGSAYNVAALASSDGRHVAMMPHPERAVFPWQCATYPAANIKDDVTPWIEIFRNAYNWVAGK
jgi:phosphoribosylformylglycinamidine synthase